MLVATLGPGAVPIGTLDITYPVALVFGNEAEGVSAEMRSAADESCFFPLAGFVESLNVSVAAALCLQQALASRPSRQSELGAEDRLVLLAAYYMRAVQHAEALLARYAEGR